MKTDLQVLQETDLQLQIASRKDVIVAIKTDFIRAALRNQIANSTGKTDQEVQEYCELEAIKNKS